MGDYPEGVDDEGWETVGKNKKGKEKKKVEKKEAVGQNRNQGTPKNTKTGGAQRKGNKRSYLTQDAGKIESLMPEWRRRDVPKEKKTIQKNVKKAPKQTKNTPRKTFPKERVDERKCVEANQTQKPSQMQDINTGQLESILHDPLPAQNSEKEEDDKTDQQQSQCFIPPQYGLNGINVQAAILQALAYNAVNANVQGAGCVGWNGIASNEMGYFSFPQGFIPNQEIIIPHASWFGAPNNYASNRNDRSNPGQSLDQLAEEGEKQVPVKAEENAKTSNGEEMPDLPVPKNGYSHSNAHLQERSCRVKDAGDELEPPGVEEIARISQGDASNPKDGNFDASTHLKNSEMMKESNVDTIINQTAFHEDETRTNKETEKPDVDCTTVQQNDSTATSKVRPICSEQSITAIANETLVVLLKTNKSNVSDCLQQAEDRHKSKGAQLDDKRLDDSDTVSSENTNNNCRETTPDDIEMDLEESNEDVKRHEEVDKVTLFKSTGVPQTEEDKVSHSDDESILGIEIKSAVADRVNITTQDPEGFVVPGVNLPEDKSSQSSTEDPSSENGSTSVGVGDTEIEEKIDGLSSEGVQNKCKVADIKECHVNNGISAKDENARDETKAKKKTKKNKTKKKRNPTYGEVIDYLMAELKRNYAGKDMNDIFKITQIEDTPLPDGLQRQVMDLRMLSLNYQPCRNPYVDDQKSHGASDDSDNASSDDDYEATADDFGRRRIDRSCNQGNDKLLQRFSENLHSFVKTSHLLEIVSTPQLYGEMSQTVMNLTLAQESFSREPDVADIKQVSNNEEKLPRDREEGDMCKTQSIDENSRILTLERSDVENFEVYKAHLEPSIDKCTFSKASTPYESNLTSDPTLKCHAEDNIDATIAHDQAAPFGTTTTADYLPPAAFLDRASENSTSSQKCESRYERRIHGLGYEYRSILQDILYSLNGPLQAEDLEYILRSRLTDMKRGLERYFVDFSLETQRSNNRKATADLWNRGDSERSWLPNGLCEVTPTMNEKDECDYDEGVLENGWLDKDFLETLTGNMECVSTEEHETPSKNLRKLKPLKYWWMP